MDGPDPYLMQPRKEVLGHIDGFLEAIQSVIRRAHIVGSLPMCTRIMYVASKWVDRQLNDCLDLDEYGK